MPPDHARHFQVIGVVDFRHDVVGLFPPPDCAGQGQDALDHVRVGVVVLAGQDDDRARAVRVDDVQIGGIDRAAGPADDAGILRIPDPAADFVFHRDFVHFGQDGDAGVRAVLVGDHQLGEDRKNLRRPAQDHGVIPLDDERAALAQILDFGVDGVGQDTDQDAQDQDAEQRRRRHQDHEDRVAGRVATQRARIDGVHQAEPEHFGHIARVVTAAGGGRAGDDADQGDDQQHGHGRDQQPADHRAHAARHEIVETIAKALAPGNVAHVGPTLDLDG